MRQEMTTSKLPRDRPAEAAGKDCGSLTQGPAAAALEAETLFTCCYFPSKAAVVSPSVCSACVSGKRSTVVGSALIQSALACASLSSHLERGLIGSASTPRESDTPHVFPSYEERAATETARADATAGSLLPSAVCTSARRQLRSVECEQAMSPLDSNADRPASE